MKKIVCLLLGFITTVGLCSAQKIKLTPESVKCLLPEPEVLFEIDYSEAIFDGMTLEEMVFDMGEEDWSKSKKELILKFTRAANERLSWNNIRLSPIPNENQNYKFLLAVKSVDDDGETRGILYLIKISDNSTIWERDYDAEGGRWGTLTNLMGDAMTEGGEKFANTLGLAIRKAREIFPEE